MNRLLLAVALLGLSTSVVADEFAQEFRDQQFSEGSLRIVGSQSFLLREPDGLRIELKKDTVNSSNCGVAFALELNGDCAFETAVELIDQATPEAGYGTGVALLFEDGGPNGASFQNVVMPDGNHVYVTHKFFRNEEGEYKHEAKSYPALSSKAVMRLERLGKLVKYQIQEAGMSDFKELGQFPFTDRPIKVAQVYAQLGGDPTDLNVRIANFKVEADEFLRPGQPPRKKPAAINWLALSWLLVLPVVGGLIWWSRRSR